MKRVLRFSAAMACAILASCASDAGHFDGGEGQRKGSGNAEIKGPDAGDVIHDTHRDRKRQNYEDRSARRYYGKFN